MLIDSHCHLDRLKFDDLTIADVLDNAKARGVSHLLCVSIHLNQFEHMMQSIKGFDNVFASCGVHPLNQEETFEYEQLLSLADNPEVVAIGETGLDYYYAEETREIQKVAFGQHIDAAKALNKPLIIHTRDAREDTIRIMDEHGADSVGGVFHCFTESLENGQAGDGQGLLYLDFRHCHFPQCRRASRSGQASAAGTVVG